MRVCHSIAISCIMITNARARIIIVDDQNRKHRIPAHHISEIVHVHARMRLSAFQLCYLVLFICTVLAPVTASNSCGVTFVLLGSTGSLARLYLWPALFKWHSSSHRSPRCELVVFGASRKPFTDEEGTWREITSNLKCNNTEQICAEAVPRFKKATNFIQIRSHDHYEILQRQIQQLYSSKGLKEVGRVFYLSIPPWGYQEVSQNIHEYTRPEPGTWLRVVLEKPFGSDLASAKLLASELSKYLSDEEIYRVDHYLGKFGVEQILPFRLENNDVLSRPWNRDSVQFVEVAMKERLDVKGRSKFYDSYGVIRDVLQNHLTEILVRLLVPAQVHDPEQFIKAKKKVLSKLYPPMLKHSLLGQYMDYHEHLKEDGVLQQLEDGNSSESLTPTFASVALYLRDPPWHGVPFILVSGKQLDKRTAYARVVFKQRQFRLRASSDQLSCLPEIIFLIQDEQFTSPGILISEQLSSLELVPPSSMDSVSWSHDITKYPKGGSGDCKYTYLHPSQVVEANAYVSLIKAILEGRHEYFVDTDSLLLAWEVWSPLLHEMELSKQVLHLKPYSPDVLEGLNFELMGTQMLPMESILSVIDTDHRLMSSTDVLVSKRNGSSFWSELLGHRSIVAHKYSLSSLIAEDILRAAQDSVKQRGEFHLALPGGQSPVLPLNILSLDYSASFPWQQTHIWQTDERCVKATSQESNWMQISELLLSVVSIPFHHLHPMPTDLQNGVCSSDDRGDALYHNTLNKFLLEDKLDYIVLGVGTDGHIASIFPKAATGAASMSDDFVMITELKPSYTTRTKKRMTLTLDAILKARSIAVIFIGAEKKSLLDKVRECLELEELCDLPLVKLLKSTSVYQLSLYIDSDLV